MARSRKGQFVLVKWINDDIWDVLNCEKCFKHEKSLKKEILENMSKYIGRTLDFFWKDGEELAPGILLDFGSETDMEEKRTIVMKDHFRRTEKLVSPEDQNVLHAIDDPKVANPIEKSQLDLMNVVQSANNPSPPTQKCMECTNNKRKYRDLKYEIRKLKDESEEKEIIHAKVARKLQKYKEKCNELRSQRLAEQKNKSFSQSFTADENEAEHSKKVEIAPNVSVDKAELSLLLRTSKTPTIFARGVFMLLFSEDEYTNSSISGRSSNAHKNIPPKKKLDPKKVAAIIALTLKKYQNANARQITESLANKIKELSEERKKI